MLGKGGVFCIDDKVYLYCKISNAKYGYSEYVECIMKIILSNFHNSSEIKESNLIINDKEYKVDLDGNFFDTSNAAIWLFSDRYYVLEKNGIDGELYTSKEYEHTFGNTKDELIKRFPSLLKIPRMTYRIIQKFKKINYVFLEI